MKRFLALMYDEQNTNDKDDENCDEDGNKIRHCRYGEATSISLFHDEN